MNYVPGDGLDYLKDQLLEALISLRLILSVYYIVVLSFTKDRQLFGLVLIFLRFNFEYHLRVDVFDGGIKDLLLELGIFFGHVVHVILESGLA